MFKLTHKKNLKTFGLTLKIQTGSTRDNVNYTDFRLSIGGGTKRKIGIRI